MNNICYFSIDFEDFCYDYRKMHNINFNEKINKLAIDETYQEINNFCKKKLLESRITFFCTGILAKKYPEIIRKISQDGHEIACHYHYHDMIYKDTIHEFEDNIKKSIYYLSKASNQKIKGFRAPFFSLKKNHIEQINILSKYFDYDSSLIFNDIKDLINYKKNNCIKNISLYPVFGKKMNCFMNTKLGGTYFKILNKKKISSLIQESHSKGIIPIVYMHPYEFTSKKLFFLNFNKFKNVNFIKKTFLYFNQMRWHIYNEGIKNKLDYIFTKYRSGGKLNKLKKYYS